MKRLILVLAVAAALPAQIPAPEDVLGFSPGDDGRLANYADILGYMRQLADASDRVSYEVVGKTTEDRDFVSVLISAPENLARVDEIRRDNLRLADPRKLSDEDAAAIVKRGKTIVLLNESIHSTEVGPAQAGMVTAHFLATTKDPAWTKVLDDVVIVLTPCHNPDGYATVVAWWRKFKDDKERRGVGLPVLYHKYVGHDNNRDWFMLTQKESRVSVETGHMRWRPQIVIDQHQMGGSGARMFVPPYQEPYEPYVHPLLREGLTNLGRSVLKGMAAEGNHGVWCNRGFDAWTPARAFQHYHGGVRILTEVASARLADPNERVRPPRGDAGTVSEDNPSPWKGGRWALSDIVRYTSRGALLAIKHGSDERETWLKNFLQIHRDYCDGKYGPKAYVIPPNGRTLMTRKLIDLLTLGGVEVCVTNDPPGGLVIKNGQPCFGFACALLENSPYPVIRPRPGAPIRRPYDMTCHSLPLLMDFQLSKIEDGELPECEPVDLGRLEIPIKEDRDERIVIRKLKTGKKRIGVYWSWTASMDEGWTRFWFDMFKIPFTPLRPADVRAGKLKDRVDVILFASVDGRSLTGGPRDRRLPDSYKGGLGLEGRAALKEFVGAGGTMVCMNASSALALQMFDLPVERVGRGGGRRRRGDGDQPRASRTYIPGSVVRALVDTKHPLGVGCNTVTPIFLRQARPFGLKPGDTDVKVSFPVRYVDENLVAGGFAEGAEVLHGKAAAAVCEVGQGKVVLFAFSPQFRCQTWSTFRLLLNALLL
ncbi:MAG: hypothetical protein HRU14_02520 [Planctomycetes bacterium]|nr:hypothetical protein [Planctomycetota bacterium]